MVLNKFNIGDVIVSLNNIERTRQVGDMFRVLNESALKRLYYMNGICTSDPSTFRTATMEENKQFQLGVTNVKNISKEKSLVGSQLDCLKNNVWAKKVTKSEWNIGDWVVNINTRWNGRATKSDSYREELGLVGKIDKVLEPEKGSNIYAFSIKWVNGDYCGKDSNQIRKAEPHEIPTMIMSIDPVDTPSLTAGKVIRKYSTPSISPKKEKIKANIIPVKTKQVLF